MNTLRNKVQLIGNLGNDPEIITLESGKKLAKFSIATNESYKNAMGEKVTDTQWHNIIAISFPFVTYFSIISAVLFHAITLCVETRNTFSPST